MYVLTALGLLMHYRSRAHIAPRSPRLVALQTLACLGMVNVQLLRLAFPGSIPCFVILWISTLSLPLMMLLFTVRLIRLAILFRSGRVHIRDYHRSIPSDRPSLSQRHRRPLSLTSPSEQPHPSFIPSLVVIPSQNHSMDGMGEQEGREDIHSSSSSSSPLSSLSSSPSPNCSRCSQPISSSLPSTPSPSPSSSLSRSASFHSISSSRSSFSRSISSPPTPVPSQSSSRPPLPTPNNTLITGVSSAKWTNTRIHRSNSYHPTEVVGPYGEMSLRGRMDRTLVRMSHRVSDRFLMGLLIFFILAQVGMLTLVQTHSTRYAPEKRRCQAGWELLPLYSLTFLGFLCLLPTSLVIRGVDDAFGIRLEMDMSVMVGAIGYLVSCAVDMFYDRGPIRALAKYIPGPLFLVTALMCLLHIQVGVPVYEALRRRPTPATEFLDWSSFQDFLQDPEELAQLRAFAVREFSVENVLFYERVTHLIHLSSLRLHSAHTLADVYEVQAMVRRELWAIHELFLRPGSELEVNLPSSTRKDLAETFGPGKFPDDARVLLQAREDIARLMYENTYPRLVAHRKAHATFTGPRCIGVHSLCHPCRKASMT
ncbi:MAG: hypothetical protein DHS80DRAFT_29279 [Piptocephalis tieghemiana]|nr:MAG: hypothetical protein DHS80DRAFT_29279 [Piptocephalis tieghemiana]